jgi:hypothetical protein
MKNSSEQYLKYLAALSLSVAAPAMARPAMPQAAAAERPAVEHRVSDNLQLLAASIEMDEQVPGATGWPESTHVGRIAQLPNVKRAEANTSLTWLMDEVLTELRAR